MFATIREGNKETSTKEVKSLLRLRLSLTSTNNIKIRDLNIIGAHSAKLRFAMIDSIYFGDFAKITRINQRAKVKKVVTKSFPFLCQ